MLYPQNGDCIVTIGGLKLLDHLCLLSVIETLYLEMPNQNKFDQ